LKEQIDQQYKNIPLLKKLDDVSLTMTLLRVSQFSPVQYIERLRKLYSQLDDLQQLNMRIPMRLISELEDYLAEQEQLTVV
ncbi:hypothetical protein CGH75_27295, partial [Vibrio parahaemolyticus]